MVGSVNTGASDTVDAIADVCERHDVWLHADGAFGAFFRLWEPAAGLVAGLERADSLAVDGHKWLNVPNGVGFVLLKDAALHRETFAGSAAYLTPGAGANLHELGIEASRSWRGATVWAALKSLGRDGMVDLVTRCCVLAQGLARAVEASPRLELTAPAPTNTVCFRYRPEGWAEGDELDDLNRRIQADVVAAGDVFFTGAELEERRVPAHRDRLLAHGRRGRSGAPRRRRGGRGAPELALADRRDPTRRKRNPVPL